MFHLLSLKNALIFGARAPDGKRWRISGVQRSGVPPFIVAVNWPALLKK